MPVSESLVAAAALRSSDDGAPQQPAATAGRDSWAQPPATTAARPTAARVPTVSVLESRGGRGASVTYNTPGTSFNSDATSPGLSQTLLNVSSASHRGPAATSTRAAPLPPDNAHPPLRGMAEQLSAIEAATAADTTAEARAAAAAAEAAAAAASTPGRPPPAPARSFNRIPSLRNMLSSRCVGHLGCLRAHHPSAACVHTTPQLLESTPTLDCLLPHQPPAACFHTSRRLLAFVPALDCVLPFQGRVELSPAVQTAGMSKE
eukprot:356056-Chlamydomonas_euryale.AAC.5